MTSSALSNLIKKSILHIGKGDTNFPDGTKVTFHVKVEVCETETHLDDSRDWSEPVELILGKKFKLEVLEACVRTMMIGEVSKFEIDKKLLSTYPVVARTLRDYHAKKSGKKVEPRQHHCCGLGIKEGLGYPDLDDLVAEPKDLRFTIELLKTESSGSYQKEFWAMSEEEQRSSISILKEEGNALYKQGDYVEASKKYSEAIGRLENLMLKEKPNDEEWNELNQQKLSLLLNFSQCQLVLGEYYPAIEHCSEVLKYEPENVKALFRRGKAHVKVFSGKEAREDLAKVAQLDSSLVAGCQKLLNELQISEKEKLLEDKKVYKKLFS